MGVGHPWWGSSLGSSGSGIIFLIGGSANFIPPEIAVPPVVLGSLRVKGGFYWPRDRSRGSKAGPWVIIAWEGYRRLGPARQPGPAARQNGNTHDLRV
eukprot:748973-Hanusia_phi.AAC.1